MRIAVVPLVMSVFAFPMGLLFWYVGERVWQPGAILTAGSIVLGFGAWLLSGRRPVVLYLRRFGDARGAERHTRLTDDLARAFRVVALSDPVTNPVASTFFAVAGCILAAVVLLAIEIPTGVLVHRITGFDPSPLFYVPTLVFGGILSLAFATRLTDWRRRRVTARIASREDLEAAVARARRWRRMSLDEFFSLWQIQAIGVDDALWRDAVQEFAAYADAILIDLSTVGESLLWEIRTLRPLHSGRMVVIAAEAPRDPALLEVLGTHPVLPAGPPHRNIRREIWKSVLASETR
jgi:hypothetical protein